jgi:hypothetical protein
MAPRFVPTVEINYQIDDQRQGVSTAMATLSVKDGGVYMPAGVYDPTELLDAMHLLLHTPHDKQQTVTPKPERP